MKILPVLFITAISPIVLIANDVTKNLSNLINSEGNLASFPSNDGLESYSSSTTNANVVIQVGGEASNDGYLGSTITTNGTSVSWDFDTDGYNKGDLRIVNQSDEPLNLRKIKIEGSWSGGSSDSPHMRLVYLDSDTVDESGNVTGSISDLTKGIIPSSSEALTHFQSFYNNALKVRVTSAGTTSLTQGNIITLNDFNNANVGASTPAESTAVTYVKVVSKGDTNLTEGSYVTNTLFNSSNSNLLAGSANAAEATNDGTTYAYVPLDSTFSETILIGEIISTKAWIPAGGSASFRILFDSPDSNTYSFNLSNVEFEGFLYSQFPSAVADDAASYVAGVGDIGIYDFYQNDYTPTPFVTTGENRTTVEDMAIKIENGDLELVLGKYVSGTDIIGGESYQTLMDDFENVGGDNNQGGTSASGTLQLDVGNINDTGWDTYDAQGINNGFSYTGGTNSIKFGNSGNQQRLRFRITNNSAADVTLSNISYRVRNIYGNNHPDDLTLSIVDGSVIGTHTFGGSTVGSNDHSYGADFALIENDLTLLPQAITIAAGAYEDFQLKYDDLRGNTTGQTQLDNIQINGSSGSTTVDIVEYAASNAGFNGFGMTYDGGLGGLNDDSYGSSFLVENLTADDASTTEVNEQTRPSAWQFGNGNDQFKGDIRITNNSPDKDFHLQQMFFDARTANTESHRNRLRVVYIDGSEATGDNVITADLLTGKEANNASAVANEKTMFSYIWDKGESGTEAGKRGMAFSQEIKEQWNDIATAFNPSWHYTWGNAYQGDEYHPEGVEFVPQFWGRSSVTQSNVDALVPLIQSGKVKNIILFNEPDLSTQANMSVFEAVNLTVALQAMFEGAGISLEDVGFVSPVVTGAGASYNGGNSYIWLTEYMDQAIASGCKIDYIGMHKYVYNKDPSVFTANLYDSYSTYVASYGKKVWLKEFSLKDGSGNGFTEQEVENLMTGVLDYLDAADWIYRYAWFSARTDGDYIGNGQEYSVLWDNTAGANGVITSLGTHYGSFANDGGFVDENNNGIQDPLVSGTISVQRNLNEILDGKGILRPGKSAIFRFVWDVDDLEKYGVTDNAGATANDPADGILNYIDLNASLLGKTQIDNIAFKGTFYSQTDTDGDSYADYGDDMPTDPRDFIDKDGDGVGGSTLVLTNDGEFITKHRYDYLVAAGSDPGMIGTPYDADDGLDENPNEVVDSDLDGIGDNSDAYPSDPNKSAIRRLHVNPTVTVVSGAWRLDSNEYIAKYGMGIGVYTFKDIPVSHPLTILSGNSGNHGSDISQYDPDSASQYITITGSNLAFDEGIRYYTGDMTVTVTGDFGDASLHCLNHGFMSGSDILVYGSQYAHNPMPEVEIDAGSLKYASSDFDPSYIYYSDSVDGTYQALSRTGTVANGTTSVDISDVLASGQIDTNSMPNAFFKIINEDTDNDGYYDFEDELPNNSSEISDSDGDGVGDNTDAFPSDPAETADADGDGVGDNADWDDADTNEWADSDGDGVGDNTDTDYAERDVVIGWTSFETIEGSENKPVDDFAPDVFTATGVDASSTIQEFTAATGLSFIIGKSAIKTDIYGDGDGKGGAGIFKYNAFGTDQTFGPSVALGGIAHTEVNPTSKHALRFEAGKGAKELSIKVTNDSNKDFVIRDVFYDYRRVAATGLKNINIVELSGLPDNKDTVTTFNSLDKREDYTILRTHSYPVESSVANEDLFTINKTVPAGGSYTFSIIASDDSIDNNDSSKPWSMLDNIAIRGDFDNN
jgi:hypothetical protein